jgi:hypothetical protein
VCSQNAGGGLKVGRLKWFGHVKRGVGALGIVVNVDVEGRIPPGSPTKSWRCVDEDLSRLGGWRRGLGQDEMEGTHQTSSPLKREN